MNEEKNHQLAIPIGGRILHFAGLPWAEADIADTKVDTGFNLWVRSKHTLPRAEARGFANLAPLGAAPKGQGSGSHRFQPVDELIEPQNKAWRCLDLGHTYHQLRYHVVFSTKDRHPWIDSEIEDMVYQYIRGIIHNLGGRLIAIGGMPDHVHILTSAKPSVAPSRLVQEIKGASSRWISEEHSRVFAWQPGYGIFSVSESQAPIVARYIRNQKEHHRKKSFDEEWTRLLRHHGLEPE